MILPRYKLKSKSYIFSNALLAVIFAFYYSLLVEQVDIATFKVLQTWDSESPTIRSDTKAFLYQCILPFLKHLTQYYDSPISEWHGALLDRDIVFGKHLGSLNFHVQIYIFYSNTGNFLESYPPEYEHSRRPLFLLARYDETQLTNFDIVTNLTSFFNCFGTFCFYCKTFFKGRGTQHKCSKAINCFVCKRPFLKVNTFVHDQIKHLFCNTSISARETKFCMKCDLRMYSVECERHHHKKVCRFGWACKLCETYTFCSKNAPNIHSIKKNHKCGVKQCYFCGGKKNKGHQCDFQIPAPT